MYYFLGRHDYIMFAEINFYKRIGDFDLAISLLYLDCLLIRCGLPQFTQIRITKILCHFVSAITKFFVFMNQGFTRDQEMLAILDLENSIG